MSHPVSHSQLPRQTRHTNRAYSQTSSYATTCHSVIHSRTASPAPPQPGPPRPSSLADTSSPPQGSGFQLPAYWTLKPTVPSPFAGTLEASLDAILEWGRQWSGGGGGGEETGPQVRNIVATLLGDVDRRTNWPALINRLLLRDAGTESAGIQSGHGSSSSSSSRRQLAEELLFLATRTLLPEQIVENRGALARVYDGKRHLAIRLVLRYDMLREMKVSGSGGKDGRPHAVIVNSVAPEQEKQEKQEKRVVVSGAAPQQSDLESHYQTPFPPQRPSFSSSSSSSLHRRPLMPNVWPTLILPPPHLLTHGFLTHGYRERMRHHVTDLDALLLYTDDQVRGWSDAMLVARTATVLLMWQWVRRSNEMLAGMEIEGWEELDGKAEDCLWVA